MFMELWILKRVSQARIYIAHCCRVTEQWKSTHTTIRIRYNMSKYRHICLLSFSWM